MTKTLVLCDCLGSQAPDAARLEAATGQPCTKVHTALCTRELPAAADLLKAGPCRIACGQEMTVFEDLASELGVEAPDFVDLRDRAGWTAAGADAVPKMAALAADAALPPAPAPVMDVVSGGACLVIGGAAALDAGERLAESQAVTVMLAPDADLPLTRGVDVITGQIKRAQGAIGAFEVAIDGFRQPEPGGRGAFAWGPARDGAVTHCDVILDLSGGTPLFAAPEKRDGYLRADPGDPVAVARAVHKAADLVGTFEKPLHVAVEPHLCAHSRAAQVACTRCLDACPTGAIAPDGDHVAVDPLICAGCGACSALCPSGAITYAAPPPQALFTRLRVLAETYRKAGGSAPRLLVHDADHGAEMIRLAARFGRGLPPEVIPVEVEALAGFGHAEVLAALAVGFAAVDILLAPKTERDVPEREAALVAAILETSPLRLLDLSDPDALSDALYDQPMPLPVAAPVLPLGGRREVVRLAMKALRPDLDTPVPLPPAAPYGAVLVDTEACTLCLSCAGLCPSGALGDNPDRPQLTFQEDACLQCGLCATVCPEDAIQLAPQFNPADSALSAQVVNEEEPALCIECGKAFGVASTIERIVAQLEGKHPMFRDSAQGQLIRMCDDCRVQAQYHSEDNPFAAGPRPPVRTTDDYLN